MNIDTETVTTDAGDYVVKFIHDDDSEKPYNEGLGFAFAGRKISALEASDGDHAADVLAILYDNLWGWNNDGTPNYRHSSAGIGRYMRMKWGLTGIREVGADYRTSAPDATLSNVYGMAWAPCDVRVEHADEYTKTSIAEYRAWAEGDAFGYVIEGPDGNEIEDGSLWGFYGFSENRSYALGEATDAIDYDVAQRQRNANLVGAGFVGLI